ncbi:MAG: class I SAM-dependent methyltransferase [Cyanobacteria bacterium P01_H01_bin.26]
MRVCWCGNSEFDAFSDQYGRCNNCKTLVSLESLSDEQLIVRDDSKDFYGKQYWLNHQQEDLGLPDIYARSRNDLKERNLHWLKALLKYSIPPAKVLELGCSHGSFVALMAQAGYQSMGVEMSPWVVEFGRKNFNIPINVGPIENLDIPYQSLDAIALMDVLEHLPNPINTMRYCMKLLKPNGFLLIQTPEFHESMDYETLLEENNPFLKQLKADEHLYLFSQESVADLLGQIGLTHVYFEPAIFSQYDMFFVASKAELKTFDVIESYAALQKTVNGRIALALLDLRESELKQTERLYLSDKDREARLRKIHILTEKVHVLTQQLENAKADNLELQESMTQTHKLFEKRLSGQSSQFEVALNRRNSQISRLKAQLSNPIVQASLKATKMLSRIIRK